MPQLLCVLKVLQALESIRIVASIINESSATSEATTKVAEIQFSLGEFLMEPHRVWIRDGPLSQLQTPKNVKKFVSKVSIGFLIEHASLPQSTFLLTGFAGTLAVSLQRHHCCGS